MKKLFLLDGFALIFRAYYALMKTPRITSYGKNTNAQLGFTNTLLEILNKEKPSHIAVAFDTAAPTERTELYADYKANRQETPEDILAATPDIKNILKAMNIAVLENEGFEADDIIGTLATQAEQDNFQVYIVSQDKDFGQLVNDNIFIYKPAFQKNERKILGINEVCEQWDIDTPKKVIDILGLMGDAVDNIPGVAGIGEKTASKLLKEFDSIENIIANVENIKGAVGTKIKNNIPNAIMSKKLATINIAVPIKIKADNLEVTNFNKEILSEIFNTLEFKTLSKRIFGEPTKKEADTPNLFSTPIDTDNANNEKNEAITNQFNTINNTPHNYILIETEQEILSLTNTLSQQKIICIDTETTGLKTFEDDIVGMNICYEKASAYYITLPKDKNETQRLLKILDPIFNNHNILWIGQNIKFDINILSNYDIKFKGNFYDTMIVQYLLDGESKRNMDFLSTKYLNYQPISIETLIGKGTKQKSMRDVELELIKEYAAEDADITFQLYNHFEDNKLLDDKLKNLFKIEMQLIQVLSKVEQNGVSIDKDYLKNMSDEFQEKIAHTEKNIYELTDSVFNIASPKQLGEILFTKLKIQANNKISKTKTGQYATDDSVLEKLINTHPCIPYIIEFRELSKLKSTYIDALPTMINPKTNRVHTTFNQTRAITGRLSSLNPNLQNIPVKTEIGSRIRKAFITIDENNTLISADYSQIELRIIASLSNDKNMIESFQQNKDIHTATAAKIYNINEADVNKEMRYKAKSVNFGIIYGQGAWGLSQNIKISKSEAKQLIDNYFLQYPDIKKFMDNQVIFAQKNGFVETLLGRKRWLRDINSANMTVRGFAERNAVNMPIQGTAADMIKIAMINIQNKINTENIDAKMILQVHDELLFEVHKNSIEKMTQIISLEMPNALPLNNEVPVTISIGKGKNWLEAH